MTIHTILLSVVNVVFEFEKITSSCTEDLRVLPDIMNLYLKPKIKMHN